MGHLPTSWQERKIKVANKRLCLILFCLAFATVLTGCSKNAPVAEKDLMSYLERNDPMVGRMGSVISYHDLTVDKRLTDSDNHEDQVWVHFFANTETDMAEVDACMEFVLYNDGWRLEDIEILTTVYTAVKGPDYLVPESQIAWQYDDYECYDEDINLDEGTAVFYYRTAKYYAYVDVETELAVNCYYVGYNYSPDWAVGFVDVISYTEDWQRIYGTWEGADRSQDPAADCVIRIENIKVTENGLAATLEGSYQVLHYFAGRYSDIYKEDNRKFDLEKWSDHTQEDLEWWFGYGGMSITHRAIRITPSGVRFRNAYLQQTSTFQNSSDSSMGVSAPENNLSDTDKEPVYLPGTYTGTGSGWGDITVSITVDEYSITDIRVIQHTETAGVGTRAFNPLAEAMLKRNSADVDAVSGSTITSNGVIAAVKDALAKAQKP